MPKDQRYRTFPGRYSNGNVHKFQYDSENKGWLVPCRQALADGRIPHGEQVSVDEPLTCLKCIKGHYRRS